MMPTLKQDKHPLNQDSYRPINNLPTLDKIIEEHLKTSLYTHLDNYKIIYKNHHKFCKHHETHTATTHITHEVNNRYDKFK